MAPKVKTNEKKTFFYKNNKKKLVFSYLTK